MRKIINILDYPIKITFSPMIKGLLVYGNTNWLIRKSLAARISTCFTMNYINCA